MPGSFTCRLKTPLAQNQELRIQANQGGAGSEQGIITHVDMLGPDKQFTKNLIGTKGRGESPELEAQRKARG